MVTSVPPLPSPACETWMMCPAITRLPTRGDKPAFASTVICTLPGPVPEAVERCRNALSLAAIGRNSQGAVVPVGGKLRRQRRHGIVAATAAVLRHGDRGASDGVVADPSVGVGVVVDRETDAVSVAQGVNRTFLEHRVGVGM